MFVMMLWNLYTQYARVFNMMVLAGCIAGLTANMIVRRGKIIRRVRRITGWIYLVLLNFVYSYSISIREHRPFNYSVFTGSILLIGTLVAILWHPPGDDKPPPHDGALTSLFMFWLDRKVREYKTRHNIKE